MPIAGVRDHVPTPQHVALDDVPWVAAPGLDAAGRIVHVQLGEGSYVTHGRFGPGVTVLRHRHTGPVLASTTAGAWGDRESDFLNRAGSYLFEPPGSIHTLCTPPDIAEPAEASFAIHGEVLYLDADGDVVEVSDAARALQRYSESCEAAGLVRPSAILR